MSVAAGGPVLGLLTLFELKIVFSLVQRMVKETHFPKQQKLME
jgi:hypothetical protein